MARKPRAKSASAPQPPVAVIPGASEFITSSGNRDGKRITEKGLGVIEVMAAHGQSKPSIAKALGIGCHKTLDRIAERQPEVAEAMARGRGVLADELAAGFLRQFRRGNTTAGIFLCKWLLGVRENGPVESAPKIAIQINLPSPKTVEDYMRTIVASTKDAD